MNAVPEISSVYRPSGWLLGRVLPDRERAGDGFRGVLVAEAGLISERRARRIGARRSGDEHGRIVPVCGSGPWRCRERIRIRNRSLTDPRRTWRFEAGSSSGFDDTFREQRNVDVDLDVGVVVDFDGDLDLIVVSLVDAPHATKRLTRRYHRMLSFQRLRVYQRAIEFLVLATEIVEELPRGHAEQANQLIRAAESVVCNIAEGAGRWSRAEGSKHYRIARGEAMECASSLDVLKLRKLVAPRKYDRGIELLESVVSMLTKML